MKPDTLSLAFDTNAFEETGTALIKFLTGTFANADQRAVIPYKTPEEQYRYWKDDFRNQGDPLNLFKDVVDKSILYHHPHYMGHQTAVPALPTVLASLVVDFLSNGMGVYEVGMVGNTMERVICEHLCQKLGMGTDAGGFVTSGGTLATLTVILTARAHYMHHLSKKPSDKDKLAIITSEQSHYCIERAALTMGISPDRVIKIPVDEHFRMRTDVLEDSYRVATEAGKKVFCIVASAPSTSTGTYDDLETIGRFCRAEGVWFHADGAHGAPAIFSEKYKYLLKGIELADSIVMDFHKMMLTPGISTAVLLRNRADAFETFRQEAEYLWEKQDFEWQHGGKSTFECTKSMSILKVYTLFKQFGDRIFEEFIDYQYDLTREFARLVKVNPHFEVAHEPDSNILCFRYTNCENPNEVNAEIRKRLTVEGSFYIVQTSLGGNFYLRVTLLNPKTTAIHIEKLLETIVEIAEPCTHMKKF
ncbi:pyridoxal phosphate-dependent decarboxylase family protein [Bacteroides graminisolvens]|uniref:pyridoxal phosphate-dependent decarboxylase family protein n=1 Tax=Bacteroides graminisolvens TaxID=477666 RepID=UPI002409A508|nr:aminotransferase class V-fold PLP-dependent enzyme [Bacteroides graminisolvens]